MNTAHQIQPEAGLPRFERACYSAETTAYFERLAEENSKWSGRTRFYIQHVTELLAQVIAPRKKILIFGCLSPEIVERLQPSSATVVDVSAKRIELLKRRGNDPKVRYVCSAPEAFSSAEKFDYIISLNQSDYASDLALLVESLKRHAHADTKIIFSMINPAWHPLLRLVSFLRIRFPDTARNLISSDTLTTILQVKRYQVLQQFRRVLVPRNIPLVAYLANQFLSRLPGFKSLCFYQYLITRVEELPEPKKLSVSVIVPCYNEEGNVRECVLRVPQMGSHTEVIVVDDGSKDRTLSLAQELARQYPHVRVVSYGGNRGKGAAVMEGLKAAKNDVVMILDADMTVPPEELPDFLEAIESGAGEFVTGTRFVYPMETEAMRLANYAGNIFFSKLVEVVTGSPCSDTLCGTKVMRRRDFLDMRIEDSRWGDFDFIFHAARLKLKGLQIPVHYKERLAGQSKMKAFSAGIRFFNLVLGKWKRLL